MGQIICHVTPVKGAFSAHVMDTMGDLSRHLTAPGRSVLVFNELRGT